MVITEKVCVTWNSRNKDHFINKGYEYTGYMNQFWVDVDDLQEGSNVKVEFVCDYCNGENQIDEKSRYKRYYDLLKQREKGGDCCTNRDCQTSKLLNNLNKNNIKTVNKYVSECPNLLSLWNFEKNDRNPNNVTVGSGYKAWWKCSKCNHEWESKVQTRANSTGNCPNCTKPLMKTLAITHPELLDEYNILKNKDPNEISKYSTEHVWWICKTCGEEWHCQVRSRTVLNSGCPSCRESKGEKKIKDILNTYEIKYITQFEFNDLTGIRGGNLRFDFAILNENNELSLLIEYDGEFHFKKIHYDDSHEIIVEHDKRKNTYCTENDIPLLRIPYWKFDSIEKILNDKLNIN